MIFCRWEPSSANGGPPDAVTAARALIPKSKVLRGQNQRNRRKFVAIVIVMPMHTFTGLRTAVSGNRTLKTASGLVYFSVNKKCCDSSAEQTHLLLVFGDLLVSDLILALNLSTLVTIPFHWVAVSPQRVHQKISRLH